MYEATHIVYRLIGLLFPGSAAKAVGLGVDVGQAACLLAGKWAAPAITKKYRRVIVCFSKAGMELRGRTVPLCCSGSGRSGFLVKRVAIVNLAAKVSSRKGKDA